MSLQTNLFLRLKLQHYIWQETKSVFLIAPQMKKCLWLIHQFVYSITLLQHIGYWYNVRVNTVCLSFDDLAGML